MNGIIVFIIRILLALALYAFVGLLFFTIYRQYKAQINLLSPQLGFQLQLLHTDDPENKSFKINQSEAIIGRDPNCKIHIADDSISAHHARLYLQDEKWWVNDLNSTNGTFLNDEKVNLPCVIT